jgi:tetratricopeptide (TPR) repeat protein
MVLAANGFEAEAPPCYAQAERLDPANPAWPYLRGVQIADSDPNQSFPLFEKALALTSEPVEQAAIHFRLAVLLIEAGQLADADRHAVALRKIEPDGARAHFVLGLMALARDDRDAARQHLARLVEVPFIQKRACTLLAGLVDGKKAQKLLDRAARLPTDLAWPDPFEQRMRSHYVDRMSRLAPFLALEGQGRDREAIEFLRQLARESPDAETCFTLGFALYKRNQLDEAEKYLRAAIDAEPTLVSAHVFLGSSLLLRGEKKLKEADGKEAALELFRQAIVAEDKALALKNQLALAHETRGLALKHLGRRDEALKALRQAVLIQPDSPDMQLSLGEALAEADQLKEGLQHLEYAVQFARPTDPRPREALRKWQAKIKK